MQANEPKYYWQGPLPPYPAKVDLVGLAAHDQPGAPPASEATLGSGCADHGVY